MTTRGHRPSTVCARAGAHHTTTPPAIPSSVSDPSHRALPPPSLSSTAPRRVWGALTVLPHARGPASRLSLYPQIHGPIHLHSPFRPLPLPLRLVFRPHCSARRRSRSQCPAREQGPCRGVQVMAPPCATAVVAAVVVLVLVLQVSVDAGADCRFPAVFNFGDSNSDTGGLSATFGAAPPPNGRTFFGMPVGRYCDGRLVIDFIAESLGLPYLSAYLNSIGSNFTQGANFATAGSSIRRQNTSLFLSGFSPISLDVQSWEFEQFINRSQFVYNNKGGIYRELLPKAEYFSQALYTFDIGQNDITTGFFINMTSEQVLAYIPDLMERLTNIIQNVYGLGGRYFWIHNTGPIGCLPYAMVHRPDLAVVKDGAGCSVAYNTVAQLFNQRLKETVAHLRKTHADAAFTYVDVYSAKYKLISDAKKLGLDDPMLTCCGYGGGRYNFDDKVGCGGKVKVNGTWVVAGKSCDDPLKRVSWDGVHFTEAANKFVFDQIAGGKLSDPPVPLRQACQISRGQ